MKVGIGYDVHPLVPGRPLVLGGVTIDHDKGLEGHSDGDVLTHAIIDALLGAASLGDIGTHFPADDERYVDVGSIELLRDVHAKLTVEGHKVANIDATIVAEAPRMTPYIDEVRRLLADTLAVDASSVSVKATTADRLGSIGRGEGIAAIAVTLIDST